MWVSTWIEKGISTKYFKIVGLCRIAEQRIRHFGGITADSVWNRMAVSVRDAMLLFMLPRQLLRTLATQAMSNAQYFSTGSLAPEEYFHYGLALDRYTHFTSPIRRYADVIVGLLGPLSPIVRKLCLQTNNESDL